MLREGDMTPEWAALRPPKGKGMGAKRLASVWMIGPGGENKVWYANVITEGARAHGRYGPGAVMGSKNSKRSSSVAPKATNWPIKRSSWSLPSYSGV